MIAVLGTLLAIRAASMLAKTNFLK